MKVSWLAYVKVWSLILLCFASIRAVIAEPVAIPGTRVRMNKPNGFENAASFTGFQNTEVGSSIMVTEIPAPYSLTTGGFEEKRMAARGMKLLAKIKQPVGKYEGQLLELRQSQAGVEHHKWILVFGDTTFTQLVTGAFPEGQAQKLSGIVKQAILSTTFDSSAPLPAEQDDLSFEVSEVQGLKRAGRIQNALIFNTTGVLPKQKLASTPITFIAAQSISVGKLIIQDRAIFARQRLQQSPELKDVEILTDGDITICGLPGRETLARATSKSDEALFVYQVMLFSQDGYFLMRGDCPLAQREALELVFRSIAKTFKLKVSGALNKSEI